MIHPFLLSKRAVIVLSLMLVCGGCVFAPLVCFFIYQPPQFDAYTTSLKLNGSSVKGIELYYTDVDKFVKMNTTYNQIYGSGVVVSQRRFDRWRPKSCSWYNNRLFVEDTTECHHYTLKGDDAYRIVIRRHGGKIISLFASAKLGNTDLFVTIPEDQYDEFIDYEGWEQYFSSMRSKSLLLMPREYRPSPLRVDKASRPRDTATMHSVSR